MDLLLKKEEIAGTILEEVANVTDEEIKVAEADLANSHVSKENKIFGPMTELEKRIFAVIVKKIDELKQKDPHGISRSPFGQSILGFFFDLDLAEADGDIDFEGCEVLKRDIDFLKSFMAFIIPGRLGIKENFALREGFQIVALKDEDEDDDDSCKDGYKAENHFCATCPFKDECIDSPYKTTKAEE